MKQPLEFRHALACVSFLLSSCRRNFDLYESECGSVCCTNERLCNLDDVAVKSFYCFVRQVFGERVDSLEDMDFNECCCWFDTADSLDVIKTSRSTPSRVGVAGILPLNDSCTPSSFGTSISSV